MLLFDVGNTRCKWAYVTAGAWVYRGAVSNADWTPMMSELATLPRTKCVIASNVAGIELAQQLRHVYPEVKFIAAKAEQCGVRNLYDNPAQLGSDRWAALIAAWHKTKYACLVVNCGTATTIDALSAQGEFVGGLILPGVTLMQQSLSQGTAQLAEVSGSPQNFPRNTADAIKTGVLRATVGAIEYQFKLLKKNNEGAVCVLSGGAAAQVRSHLNIPLQDAENLVLEGLQVMGEARVW